MFKNNKYSKNPIIVSGIPRTATTTVGKLISNKAPYSVIYEPFNSSQGLKSIDMNYLIPGSNIMENDFDRILDNLLNLNGSFKLGKNKNDSIFKKFIKYTIGNQSSISFKKAKYLDRNKDLLIKIISISSVGEAGVPVDNNLKALNELLRYKQSVYC